MITAEHHAGRKPVWDLQCEWISKLSKWRRTIDKVLNAENMRNYFLKASVVSIIGAFATSMSLRHVCLFGAIEPNSEIARFKLLAHVHMDETLNDFEIARRSEMQ